MVASDNPAGRLVAILERARKQSGNKKAREVWGEVFGVEATDTANLLYMYAQLIQLIRTAKDAVEQLDHVDHSIYLKPFSKLERVFAKANLEGTWQGTRNEIDDATVVALQFCADMLSRERGEGEIDEELLVELNTAVSEILEKVVASDLPDCLRIVLAENLEAIRRAILEYRLRGAEGLRRALETAIGSLIRHSEFSPDDWMLTRVRIILLLALIAPLASASCSQVRPCPEAAPAQPAPAAVAAPDYAALDTYIRGAMSDWSVPGLAIAVVKDDSVVFAQGYGVRRLGDLEPVDVRTLFGLLSPTKTMAAAALGILVDEGRISWDDPVVDHLPWFRVSDPVATREIRIRDLLSHGTGYQEDHRLWYDRGGTTGEVARRTPELDRIAPLDTEFHYNNIMYVVAGKVVEAVAGVPWHAFVRERIFQPLGMTTSTTGVRALAERTNVASPHARRVFGRLGPVRPIQYLDIDNIGLAGSVHTNVDEASQSLRMLLNHGVYEGDRVLEAGTVAEMGRPQVPLPAEFVGSPAFAPLCGFVDFGSLSYGLGWFVMSYRGHHTLIHGGGINGQRSAVALLPGQRAGVVILSNLQDTEIPLALAWTVLDLFLDVEPRDWSAAYRNPD